VDVSRAREAGYEVLVDELFAIADDRSFVGKPDANAIVAQQRLAVDTRKWFLSKVLPHRFGDRVEVTGNPNVPIVTKITLVPVSPRTIDATPARLHPPEDEPA